MSSPTSCSPNIVIWKTSISMFSPALIVCECQQKNWQMTDQAPTVCYRLLLCGSPVFRSIAMQDCIIRNIFDVAGNIPVQLPPKDCLMDGNKPFEMLLYFYVVHAHNLDGERKILFQYFRLSAFAVVPLKPHLPDPNF